MLANGYEEAFERFSVRLPELEGFLVAIGQHDQAASSQP